MSKRLLDFISSDTCADTSRTRLLRTIYTSSWGPESLRVNVGFYHSGRWKRSRVANANRSTRQKSVNYPTLDAWQILSTSAAMAEIFCLETLKIPQSSLALLPGVTVRHGLNHYVQLHLYSQLGRTWVYKVTESSYYLINFWLDITSKTNLRIATSG